MALPASYTERIEFEAIPSGVCDARHRTATLLASADPPYDDDLIDSAVLIVSEMVTNALKEAGPVSGLAGRPGQDQISLLITLRPRGVRIEVHDSAGGHLPLPGKHCPDAETGRGLMVIAALSQRWGWGPGPRGKVVWCELQLSES
jgi:anti-sigma regulatory factor (Ser/Thr protein kinase)